MPHNFTNETSGKFLQLSGNCLDIFLIGKNVSAPESQNEFQKPN